MRGRWIGWVFLDLSIFLYLKQTRQPPPQQHHLTPPHTTSHHLTPHPFIASHHILSYHISSPLVIPTTRPTHLSDHQLAVSQRVGGQLQVEGSRASANTPRHVVVGSVAGAEPASVVTCPGDGHAAQVSADAQHDEPLRVLVAVGVGLGVLQLAEADVRFLLDLVVRSEIRGKLATY